MSTGPTAMPVGGVSAFLVVTLDEQLVSGHGGYFGRGVIGDRLGRCSDGTIDLPKRAGVGKEDDRPSGVVFGVHAGGMQENSDRPFGSWLKATT